VVKLVLFRKLFQVMSHDGDSQAELYHQDNPGSLILLETGKLELEAGIRQRPESTHKSWLRTIVAGNTDDLLTEIRSPKEQFGLSENAAVVSC
jgi:hypothetical protein